MGLVDNHPGWLAPCPSRQSNASAWRWNGDAQAVSRFRVGLPLPRQGTTELWAQPCHRCCQDRLDTAWYRRFSGAEVRPGAGGWLRSGAGSANTPRWSATMTHLPFG